MGNKIIFLNLKQQFSHLKNEISSAVLKVIESGNFIGGEQVENFEKEFAKFCKAKYCISVNSGTDALFLSLKSLGIKEGDEVITTPFTFIATAEIIANCGAKPVFVDIDPDTLLIDEKKIEEKITKNTKAIIPVHLFGKMANMSEIIKIAKKHNLFVIEDSAQFAKKEQKNRPMGHLRCFSFFPTKNLGSIGDGGLIATDSPKLSSKIKLLKNHGSDPKNKYKNLILGTNSRLDAVQAAVLRVKLKHLEDWNKKRIKIAEYYFKSFQIIKEIKIPSFEERGEYIFNQYTIRAKNRDILRKFLTAKNIQTMIYYPLPLHLQPALKYLGYKKGDFPNAEKVAKEVLSLPIYPELSQKDQNFIIEKIREFYKK